MCILTQLSKQALGSQGGLVCPGGASLSTVLPQAAVVFLLQPSNRWSKQPLANTTESHTIIMIGHSLFCFGSYFPIGLARGSTDCCDCSDSDLLWQSQQEGEKNRDLEPRIRNIQLDAEMGWRMMLPSALFSPNGMQITICLSRQLWMCTTKQGAFEHTVILLIMCWRNTGEGNRASAERDRKKEHRDCLQCPSC